MKNIEKLKELKDYQLIHVLDLLRAHVFEIQDITGAFENLDAFDLHEDDQDIQISWLNSEYNEELGFKLLTPNGVIYIKPEEIEVPSWFDPEDIEQLENMVKNRDRYLIEADEYDEDWD